MSQSSQQVTQAAADKGRAARSSDELTQTVNENEVHALPGQQGGVTPKNLSGTGFTYRHDWGDFNGSRKYNLNWSAITPNSRVFVAIGEGAPGGGKFIGGAKYTLHNVAPGNGVVSIWATIDWSSPIRFSVDYLVINP